MYVCTWCCRASDGKGQVDSLRVHVLPEVMHDTASGQLHATIPNYFTAAIETGGRFGKNLRQLLRRFALHRQADLGLPDDELVTAGRRLLQLWTQRISVKVQIGFSSRILAYINRSFDVREQLPQFYRCING